MVKCSTFIYRFYPLENYVSPGNFAKKCLLKGVKPFLGRCLAKRNRNCPNVVYKSSTRLAFVPDAKLQLSKFSRACSESKISSLPFAFSPPHFFCFSFPPFFSCVGHLLGFLSVGKGWAKSSKIVNFFLRKYEWVVGQDFHWNFLVPAQVSCQSCLGPLKPMTC